MNLEAQYAIHCTTKPPVMDFEFIAMQCNKKQIHLEEDEVLLDEDSRFAYAHIEENFLSIRNNQYNSVKRLDINALNCQWLDCSPKTSNSNRNKIPHYQ